MTHQSETVLAIQEVDGIEQVGELAAKGLQPTQIAKALGISRMEVTRRMNKWLTEHTIRLQEQAEFVHLTELARLDYMYAQVAQRAYGYYDETLEMEIPPDPKMIDILIKIIKEKREWKKLVDAKPTENRVNIEHIEVTIAQTNPLYSIAQASMEESWLGYADLDVSELYKPDDSFKKLEEQTAELAEFVDIVEIKDDDEEDES